MKNGEVGKEGGGLRKAWGGERTVGEKSGLWGEKKNVEGMERAAVCKKESVRERGENGEKVGRGAARGEEAARG